MPAKMYVQRVEAKGVSMKCHTIFSFISASLQSSSR